MFKSQKPAKYSPSHIANYFLAVAEGDKIKMTTLKLMKHVYFAYGIYLYLTNENLFDENIEAWRHGPVVPSIYHEFKNFGLYNPIKKGTYATYLDPNDADPVPRKAIVEIYDINKDKGVNHAVCGSWFYFKDKNGDDLEELTHREGTAWSNLYKPGQNIILNNSEEGIEMIKKEAEMYYKASVEMLRSIKHK